MCRGRGEGGSKGGRERAREVGREGMEGGRREGGREEAREGGRGWKEGGGKEGGRKQGREGRGDRGREVQRRSSNVQDVFWPIPGIFCYICTPEDCTLLTMTYENSFE